MKTEKQLNICTDTRRNLECFNKHNLTKNMKIKSKVATQSSSTMMI